MVHDTGSPRADGLQTSDGRALSEVARNTLRIEIEGLTALQAALEDSLEREFLQAVSLTCAVEGRVILTGVGKSGHIARKIAATLASTGTPAIFVHASEASHGDLGMITGKDMVIALSNSGETAELRDIVDYTRRFSVPLVAITSRRDSALGRAADILLLLPPVREACPIGMAPTTSTTLQLALGDALATTVLHSKGFSADQFQQFHPGGRLGAALTPVSAVMHAGNSLPLAHERDLMSDVLVLISEKGFGCAGVTDTAGRLIGIITDGDLRRAMSPRLLTRRAEDIMTRNPRTISPDMLAAQALAQLGAKVTTLFVTTQDRPVGIVHVHDLLRLGVR